MNKKITLLALLLISNLYAGVNLKNGNFYISYTDIVVAGGGQKLEMTRTYNSKSTSVGWFGFGWGNVYETKLLVGPDGCVVVSEHGSGGKTRFCPKNKVDPKAAADKIIAAIRSKSKNPLTDKTAKELKSKLVNNADLRNVYARDYDLQTKIAAGTELYSNQRGIQRIKVIKNGYIRYSDDSKKEYFNKDGDLTKIKLKDGYTTSFEYRRKRLYSIKDSQAKQIFFSWYSNGFVKELWSQGNKKALFKYEGKDLVYSKDVTGNEYAFDYDKSHNLTKIVYNPSRKKGVKEDSMQMSYEPKTFFISQIKDRNDQKIDYKYGSDPKRPNDHYWTLVTKKGFNGKPVTNRYEYEIKTKPDGSKYTYRIATEINDIKTETIYSECCGLPLKIARGKHVTNFDYNSDGQLTKKTSTKGDFLYIKYDKKVKKIAEVKNNDGWTKFKYDARGNLQKAINSKKQAVLLIWNRKDKITKMVDTNLQTKKKRILSFKYNASGKPTQILMDKVGKLTVAYDNYGEIKSVDSPERKTAAQVTQAFQNLLTIVKPAGVNLNM